MHLLYCSSFKCQLGNPKYFIFIDKYNCFRNITFNSFQAVFIRIKFQLFYNVQFIIIYYKILYYLLTAVLGCGVLAGQKKKKTLTTNLSVGVLEIHRDRIFIFSCTYTDCLFCLSFELIFFYYCWIKCLKF